MCLIKRERLLWACSYFRYGSPQSWLIYSSSSTCCPVDTRWVICIFNSHYIHTKIALLSSRVPLIMHTWTWAFGSRFLFLPWTCKFNSHIFLCLFCAAREELRAEEFTKFQAALMWSKKYCDSNPNTQLKEIMGTFLTNIFFHKIPANVLMREIYP